MNALPPAPEGAPPTAEGLADLLGHTTFVTMAALSRVAAEHDLSLTQLRLLGILRDRRVRMTALASFLGLDKSTMTGLVDRAQKRGLLTRAPNADDGRAVDVHLTPAGVELAATVQTRFAETLTTFTDRLGAADRRRLQSLLQRLVEPDQP